MQFLQNGYNSHPIETPNNIKIAKRTWSDKISSVMSSRSIKFDNNDFEECQITQNKIIMSYAVEYVKENNLKNEILAPINQVRLSKQLYLPCELVGLDGTTTTKAFNDIKEKSVIRWKFKFYKVPPTSNKTRSIWNDYLQWLKQQNVQTKVDFYNHCEYQHYISIDKRYACEVKEGVKTCYQKQEYNYRRERDIMR